MTKIYTYCLFDEHLGFHGVYSSLKAVHRDALKLANRGPASIYMETEHGPVSPSLKDLRNIFKGKCDITVRYRSGPYYADIIKTKLKE
tara:strand:- start:59 stop:322 length:264 start_codon:yes stop_codon:yes gene_type:complete